MAAQFGPHRWSAGGHQETGRYRAATVEVADLTGARFYRYAVRDLTTLERS
jgi:hypothetical protein